MLVIQLSPPLQNVWSLYEQYAFGHDELAPLSLKGRNESGSFGMMILESLSTLKMMKLEAEFQRYSGKFFLNAEC